MYSGFEPEGYIGSNIPFRPDAGITELTSEYHTSTNVHFVRKITVSWKCWSLEDLERLIPRFLTFNKLVYLEWGWNYEGKEPFSLLTKDNYEDLSEPSKLKEKVIEEGKGNFDAVIGYIDNFEWNTTDDGGFECTTNITCNGVDMLNQTLNWESYDNPYMKYLQKLLKRAKEAKLKGVTQIRDEYNVPVSVESITQRIKEHFNRIKVTRNITLGEGEASGVVLDFEDGYPSIPFRETFGYCMDNLHFSIQHFLDGSDPYLNKEGSPDNIDKITYKTTPGTGIEESREEFFEDYELQAVNTETGEVEADDSWAAWWNKYLTRRGDIKSQQAQQMAQTFGADVDVTMTTHTVKETARKRWRYDKNFIQVKNSFSGKLDKGEFEPYNPTPEQTWVRWGWFEDNILNKFFAIVKEDGTPINTIRSVIIKRDENGDPMEFKPANSVVFETNYFDIYNPTPDPYDNPYSKPGISNEDETYVDERTKQTIANEQVRIPNTEDFKTQDIKKFIFPGQFNLNIPVKDDSSDKEIIKAVENGEGEIIEFAITSAVTMDELKEVLAAENLTETVFAKYEGSIDLPTFKESSTEYLNLLSLEKISNELIPFRDENKKDKGILRNVFVNLQHLKTFFSRETTLGTALNGLLDSFNNSAPIFDLKPMIHTPDGDGKIIINDIKLSPGYIAPEEDTLFEFPIWRENSYVLSQNLATDLSSEASKILLAKRYSAADINTSPNVHIDKKKLASIEHQAWFDYVRKIAKEREEGLKKQEESSDIKIEGIHPYQLKGDVDMTTQKNLPAKWGLASGDYRFSLGKGRGVDLLAYDEDARKAIEENIKVENESKEEVLDKKEKYPFTFPGDYTPEGMLKTLAQQEVDALAENTPQPIFEPDGDLVIQPNMNDFGLIFLTNTITLSGIAGIVPTNTWTTSYLPEGFKFTSEGENHFWTENVSQTINAENWTTELTGRLMTNRKSKDKL